MQIQIALLRGVNIGGRNTVSMAKLKEAFVAAGFVDVATYINSGNILFSSNESATKLKEICEAIILDTFGLAIDTAIISADKLAEALAAAPASWGDSKECWHNAVFVMPTITVEEVCAQVGEIKPEYESIACHSSAIFWTAAKATHTKARWTGIGKTTAFKQVTIRNANTTKKLLVLAQKMS